MCLDCARLACVVLKRAHIFDVMVHDVPVDVREETVWWQLRELRATPPGLASQSDRHAVFVASMQQFEELWLAAAKSGVFSRPLPLYYALSQAGRAIAAAHYSGADFRLRGHGVHWPSTNSGLSFFDSTITPGNKGAFPAVTKALGVPVLDKPLEMGRLWFSLPELAGVKPRGMTPRWPRALPAQHLSGGSSLVMMLSSKVIVNVPWLPESLANSSDLKADLSKVLKDYPSAIGWNEPDKGFRLIKDGDHTRVTLEWVVDDSLTSSRILRFEEIAPPYFSKARHWIRPGVPQVDGTLVPVAPIMAWWALLYGFSIMARYEPDEWVALLDLDNSIHAVALEMTLERGLKSIPRLVLESLSGRKYYPDMWMNI
jgi:hypothetical protein